jgi:hypothetical protein
MSVDSDRREVVVVGGNTGFQIRGAFGHARGAPFDRLAADAAASLAGQARGKLLIAVADGA